MPLRLLSAVSSLPIQSRALRDPSEIASRSASKPGRTTPPSRMVAGGSSTSARASVFASSGAAVIRPASSRVTSAEHEPSASTTAGMASRERRSPTSSRGVAWPEAARERRRSRSPTGLSTPCRRSRKPGSLTSSSTAARRSSIDSASRSGAPSQERSCRAPTGVEVRSMSWTSAGSSRLRTVAASRGMLASGE